MRRVAASRERVALGTALGLALATLALAERGALLPLAAFALLAASAFATPWLEWTAPPERLRRALPRLHALVVLLVLTLAWTSRSLAVLQVPSNTLVLVGGLVVAPAAIAFALAPRSFPAGRTVVPATIYLLALAGLDSAVPGFGRSRLPFPPTAGHTSFAELYLGVALAVVVCLWLAAFAAAGPRWHARDVVGQVLAGGLALALAAAIVVALPLLQPHVERWVVSVVNQGSTGVSSESRLGEFAHLAQSNRIVLDLQVAPVTGGSGAGPAATPLTVAGGHWLLRSQAFTTFDGASWGPPAAARRMRIVQPSAKADAGPLLEDLGSWFRPAADAAAPRASEAALAFRVTDHDTAGWALLLPRATTHIVTQAYALQVDRFGGVSRSSEFMASRLYGALVSSEERPAPALSDDERTESLSLPANVHPDVRALASRLAPVTSPPRARLDAIVRHFHDHFTYTLDPGPWVRSDPVTEFLLDKKKGYCEYFASAAVVLLRLSGVPARYVKGVSVGPNTEEGDGLHVVRERDAHAWVEAWLPGEGWVEADPTPPAQFAAAHPGPAWWARAGHRARAWLALQWARLVGLGPLAFVRALGRDVGAQAQALARQPAAWLLALLLLASPRAWKALRARRRRRPRPPDPESAAVPAELVALVREAERRWTALGRPRPAGRGLLEHATALCSETAAGAAAPRLVAEACRGVVAAYYRARYGGAMPSPDELAGFTWPGEEAAARGRARAAS